MGGGSTIDPVVVARDTPTFGYDDERSSLGRRSFRCGTPRLRWERPPGLAFGRTQGTDSGPCKETVLKTNQRTGRRRNKDL